MSADFNRWDCWYLRGLAIGFSLVCGIAGVRALWMMAAGGAKFSPLPLAFCAGFTAAGILYQVRPEAGHHLLTGLSVVSLGATAASAPGPGVVFWMLVLAVLMRPLVGAGLARPAG